LEERRQIKAHVTILKVAATIPMDISDLIAKAESGSCVAQTILGVCYLDGIETEVDYKEAFRVLSIADAQGASRAAVNLARMYVEGLGIPQDLSKALILYEKAADAGEFLAQVELGRAYARGLGVQADPACARKWYSAAADQEGLVVDGEELREARAYLDGAL
jgi:TPR repeat protein